MIPVHDFFKTDLGPNPNACVMLDTETDHTSTEPINKRKYADVCEKHHKVIILHNSWSKTL